MEKTKYKEGVNEFSIMIDGKEYINIITIENGVRNGESVMHKHTRELNGELLHIAKTKQGEVTDCDNKNVELNIIKKLDGVVKLNSTFIDDKRVECVCSIEINGEFCEYKFQYDFSDYDMFIQPKTIFYPGYYYVNYPLNF